ncbi:MAG: hypothetical protein ABIQ95_00575 [Bdellovibrionia bacterium]
MIEKRSEEHLFLQYLHKTYDNSWDENDLPTLFGFIIRKMKIVKDSDINEVGVMG